MGWTIEIAGVTPITIDENAKFNLRTQGVYNEVGKKESIETFIDVESDIVAATASTVADNLATVRDQVSAVHTPRNVTIKLDGTTKFEFLTANCVASPRIDFHETIDDEGKGDSHWKHRFQIYGKQGGNAGRGVENVFELATSIKTIKDSDRTTRKVWQATCKAKTIQEALSFVKALKPSDDYLHEEIERFFQDQRVTGAWVWEARQKGDLYIEEEPIVVSGFGNRWIETPRVGDNSPVLHKGRKMSFRIRVRGVVKGFDKTKVKNGNPKEHYSETKDRKRLSSEEESYEVRLVDHVKGLWEQPYMEVWISTEDKIPKPNHGNHPGYDDQLTTQPADGTMPSYSNI